MLNEILHDRYLIQQQLGKKTGRRTLLARDLQTQSLVVIKLLLFSSDFEWDDLKLFEREAQILQTLSHPAIPRYLNYFELEETYGKGFALVQTYIEAPSLEAQLKAGRTFTEVEVRQLATALLDILIYLHGQQPPVIHRDIKPSNILLTDRSGNSVGQVYLVDFGSVQTLAAKEGGTITVVGTYGYMPQEQFGGRTVPASDLYSLGATLIYVVTGMHPAELPQQDFRLQFETNLSPEFTDWLQWMTEPRLEERLKSAQEASKALSQKVQRHTHKLQVKRGNSNHPSRIATPVHSRISITETTKVLDIRIPLSNLYFFTTVVAVVFITRTFISLYVSLWLLSDSFPIMGHDLLGIIAFCLIMTMGLYAVLPQVAGQLRLQLDHQKLFISYELLGLMVQIRAIPLANITRLDYVGYSSRKGSKGRNIYNPPMLIIYTSGASEYTIKSHLNFSVPELEWLAQKLGQRLKLPVNWHQLLED